MNALPILYHLVRADFWERVRRYSFLITLGLTIFIGYLFVPPADAKYVTLGLGTYRGVYNSAWIGSVVSLLTTTLLSLPGFYLVKNAIERDRQTGVGQIIATTPLSKLFYVLGKWLSNFAVLAVMVGILAVIAVAMQLLRGEELRIDLWALAAPFLLIALPAMAVVAASALLFETISWLRGGFGNVVYFFLWVGFLTIAGEQTMVTNRYAFVPTRDLFGVGVVLSSVIATCTAEFPDCDYHGFSLGVDFFEGTLQTFRWDGVQWTAEIILWRLLWVGIALGICLIATLFFHRFDPARERLRRIRCTGSIPSVAPERGAAITAGAPVHLSPLPATSMQFRPGMVLVAELRLMLKGVRRWWGLVALGLIVAGLLTPFEVAQRWLLPFAWIWPILIWSPMGVREVRHRTDQLVFSAAHVLRRQLPATWLAGVIVAILTGSGGAVRLFQAGDWAGMMAWLVGALFIPTLALALGVWSSSSKLFEAVYAFLWYLGPINQLAAFDFMGATRAAVAAGVPVIYLIITLILLALAFIGRRRQLQRD